MILIVAGIFLAVVAPCFTDSSDPGKSPFRSQKLNHKSHPLTDDQIRALTALSNTTHMNEVLDNICVVRIVGTIQHTRVKNYIKNEMRNLNWHVESDIFTERTPTFGDLEFENIIATLNPNARRYLTLACHYDSKYFRERNFVGATDSAVPCSQMINLATVMKNHLQTIKDQDVSLMFIFFDGEEAFAQWSDTDSIYGARHLAKKWQKNYNVYGNELDISDLDKIDVLVLLDLLGAPDPKFYSYFQDTQKWFRLLAEIETKLANMRQLTSYSYEKPQHKYFQSYSLRVEIQDDHLPFLERNVPVVHLIPYPFPPYWHDPRDNRRNVDMSTTENINKILRIFVASYLHINVSTPGRTAAEL